MFNDLEKFSSGKLSPELISVLGSGELGIEKESLRVLESELTQSPHPKGLGSALCNQYITTDFSEAQIEMITPPLIDKQSVLIFLDDIHHFVAQKIGKEILWPFSMPPFINSEEDIVVAEYGRSHLGLFKHIYRNGLANRYGKTMQAISGIHYNYSLSDSIWPIITNSDNSQDIRSELYFCMLRNIYRMNWIILYFFGASPILTKNFLRNGTDSYKKIDKNSYYLPYATSLRMSDFGYQNLLRNKLNVSLDSLEKYIDDLYMATITLNSDFKKIDKNNQALKEQINSNILQIEDEYYANARVKSKIISNQRSISKLKNGGVDFIELRSLDLNPFSRIGIDKETVMFIEVFLIFCFFKKSRVISKDELKNISENDLSVSKNGRDPNLFLLKDDKRISLKDWGHQILDEMMPIAELLDQKEYSYIDTIIKAKSKIDDPNKTISGRLLNRVLSENLNFIDMGMLLGEENRDSYLNRSKVNNLNWKILEKEANHSLEKQSKIELDKDTDFETFVQNYFNN